MACYFITICSIILYFDSSTRELFPWFWPRIGFIAFLTVLGSPLFGIGLGLSLYRYSLTIDSPPSKGQIITISAISLGRYIPLLGLIVGWLIGILVSIFWYGWYTLQRDKV